MMDSSDGNSAGAGAGAGPAAGSASSSDPTLAVLSPPLFPHHQFDSSLPSSSSSTFLPDTAYVSSPPHQQHQQQRNRLKRILSSSTSNYDLAASASDYAYPYSNGTLSASSSYGSSAGGGGAATMMGDSDDLSYLSDFSSSAAWSTDPSCNSSNLLDRRAAKRLRRTTSDLSASSAAGPNDAPQTAFASLSISSPAIYSTPTAQLQQQLTTIIHSPSLEAIPIVAPQLSPAHLHSTHSAAAKGMSIEVGTMGMAGTKMDGDLVLPVTPPMQQGEQHLLLLQTPETISSSAMSATSRIPLPLTPTTPQEMGENEHKSMLRGRNAKGKRKDVRMSNDYEISPNVIHVSSLDSDSSSDDDAYDVDYSYDIGAVRRAGGGGGGGGDGESGGYGSARRKTASSMMTTPPLELHPSVLLENILPSPLPPEVFHRLLASVSPSSSSISASYPSPFASSFPSTSSSSSLARLASGGGSSPGGLRRSGDLERGLVLYQPLTFGAAAPSTAKGIEGPQEQDVARRRGDITSTMTDVTGDVEEDQADMEVEPIPILISTMEMDEAAQVGLGIGEGEVEMMDLDE